MRESGFILRKIIIETSELSLISALSVTDLSGRELLSLNIESSASTIDLSSLPPGIYFIRLIGWMTAETRKIVKE